MELVASSDLAAMGAAELVRVSASIPRAAPRTFALLTACFVVPLSLAVLAHSPFTHPILLPLQQGVTHWDDLPKWLGRLMAYQFFYIIVLYTFSFLSIATTVFTVASLYAKKPASISSSLTVLPYILPELIDTFSSDPLLVSAYHVVFELTVVLLMFAYGHLHFTPNDASEAASPLPFSFVLLLLVVAFVFLGIHVYDSALRHLASVISVLEPPIYGLAALAKSKRLLQGRTGTAATLVVSYLAICGVTSSMFHAAVVEGSFGLALPGRLLVGAVLVCVMVCVNLLALIVQSVFYYACKAFHNQQIDLTALYEHLRGYLWEYVPLKSSIQMQNL